MHQDTRVVFLRGEHVYLRPLEMSDLERCQRWINDPDNRLTLVSYLPLNQIAEKEFIERCSKPEKEIHLAIVLNEGDRHIGTAGIFNIRWKDRAAEFGLMIGEADARGRGYGSEATALIIQYAFEQLNLNRFELWALAFNERAIKMYETAGFVKEGVRREAVFCDGKHVDLVGYSMLAKEYRA